jgi:uncharacterized protein YggU (UPF0235/DUF167 family)
VTNFDGAVLHVELAAPPRDNRANEELLRLLAAELRVAPSRIQLIHGRAGRHKLVEIDAPIDEIRSWLARLSL